MLNKVKSASGGRKIIFLFVVLVLINGWIGPVNAQSDDQAQARQLQDQVTSVTEKVLPACIFIGGGSGVIISEDGYILTNHHVVKDLKRWKIFRMNGQSLYARRVGFDPRGDISLLKIEGDQKFPFVPMGDSDALKIGQPVIAVGNPLGVGWNGDLVPTVTLGVVSAFHRVQGAYSDAIQTDAAINPGNSGGPLITLDGKLIGINGRMDMRFFFIKTNTGMGFAISSNQIKKFLPHFKKDGRVVHGYIKDLDVIENGNQGVRVRNVRPNNKLNLEKNDKIVKIDEYPVININRFHGIVGIYPAGTEITLTVKRRNETLEVPVVLEKRRSKTSLATRDPDDALLGVKFSLIRRTGSGVELEEVIPDTPATEMNLRAGDIITEFDEIEITSVDQILRLIASKKPGDTVTLKVHRGSNEFYVTVTLARRGNR